MSKHAQKNGRNSSRKIRRLVWVGLIVAVFALGATAAVSLGGGVAKNREQSSSNPVNAANPTTPANPHANLRLQNGGPLNPQTGQVRPLTQEEAQRLAADIKRLVNQSTEGLKSVQHADGTVSMDLQGRFQSMAVAKRNEDGELVESCVDNPEAAAVFFEIDPKLVGVNKSATAARPPKANSATKGEVQ